MTDDRNQYGFPVIDPAKLKAAQKYAAEARQRNRPECSCVSCQQIALLPAVKRIVAAEWGD